MDATNTDYRARRYLVRQALNRWIALIPPQNHATHVEDCPACGSRLNLEYAPLVLATAKCEGSACVKVML